VVRDDGDVVGPVPQRRQRDGDDVQTIEQVLAEAARPDGSLEVAVRGGDDPHIDADVLHAPDPLELVLLQHAQELCRETRRQLADLVEEESAAVGELEPQIAGTNRLLRES
jgi:hypothetical protein